MSITIPQWVRVLAGVTDPPGGSRDNLFSARNGISQIAEIRNKNNWLPVVDTFRTLAACPSPAARAAFLQIHALLAA
jgi:hypothetical protein